MSALERRREVIVRPQVGLMLSIGEPPEGDRIYPRKIDHFRPKPGTENQYADAVQKFTEVYGPAPKVIDIALISHSIGDVLDIRWKAWGTSGLKAIGQTNYALCPDRLHDADDQLVTFPDDKPGSGEYQLTGPDDPCITGKLGLKLYGVFRFAIPQVTGLTTLAEISTTSKRSMLNLLAGLRQVADLTGGHIAGIPFELAVRPARTRYFDEKKKQRKTSTFFELVFQSPYSLDEFFEIVQRRRAEMGPVHRVELPPVRHDDRDRDEEVSPSLWAGGVERRALEAADDLTVLEITDADLVDEPEPEVGAGSHGREGSASKPDSSPVPPAQTPEDALFEIPPSARNPETGE